MSSFQPQSMDEDQASLTSAELLQFFRERVKSGNPFATDHLNLRLLEVDVEQLEIKRTSGSPPNSDFRIAIVSLLFNWPSTGGGIVHTAELAQFLSLAGYDVCHFYAVYEPWQLGNVNQVLPYPNESIRFAQQDWNSATIKNKFRGALHDFSPGCVIVTDSWNTKLLLAEAATDFPYCLRLAAMECLCPLNNVRLLCDDQERPQQCQLTQLATRETCVQCVETRVNSSGWLHTAERQLAEFDLPDYGQRLRQAFANAQSILVVNNQIASLVEPYARDVRVIPSGFDIRRFENLPARTQAERPFRILFAGLVDEYMKGFHVLLAACRQLWQVRQDFELWVTTDSCHASDPFIKTCGWQSQIELPHIMAQCDVVAVPTVAQEALGRTAVEAMGASRAVIASSLGGLKEVVCDGVTGLLVKPADATDLMSGLLTMMNDPRLTTQFGANGRKRFESTFPWEKIIDRHYKPLFEACRRRT